LLEYLHFFKQICQFALLHGQIQNFLGRVVAFFAEWWSGTGSRGAEHCPPGMRTLLLVLGYIPGNKTDVNL
jgi:hypothetical protein